MGGTHKLNDACSLESKSQAGGKGSKCEDKDATGVHASIRTSSNGESGAAPLTRFFKLKEQKKKKKKKIKKKKKKKKRKTLYHRTRNCSTKILTRGT